MNITWHASWDHVLAPCKGAISNILDIISHEEFLPKPEMIFAALKIPFHEIKVVIIGQDPYPSPGMAEGLAFSVPSTLKKLPPSLINIFREYQSDLGYPEPLNGHLGPWAERGVLLLNRYLTVKPGAPLSHKNVGWEQVTDLVLARCAVNNVPIICWGSAALHAAEKARFTESSIFPSPHPSPLSAYRGFFGSRPFSQVNRYLEQQGKELVNWRLP